ncbi:LuxR C-terminal-related transcriptional regulator [Conexibacter woesei]|uniref:LuxR C-terminal-related transcriptional regulator n=1 Tax=Conexibacter woesei TaxID=191495 RepID=UPI000408CF46|nr:LuxR C-terminal-related transcriptional regulator [Conexibacter woesei]
MPHRLHGRDAERAAIAGRLAALVDGGGVILADGSAGLGKTRLLAEARELASDAGATVAAAGAEPRDRLVPLGVLRAALGAPGAGDDLTGDPAAQRLQIIRDAEHRLREAAAAAPAVVLLDDLQWADAGTIAGLRFLTSRLAAAPVLWLLAFRPGEASPELRAAATAWEAAGAPRLTLEPLAETAVAAALAELAGAPPGPELLTLARRAQGSPFLLVELLRGLQEERAIRIADGVAEVAAPRLPARIRETMRVRLRRLGPASRDVARAAAVLGRSCSFAQLSAMLDLAPSVLLGPVDAVIAADLLTSDGAALSFRHDLLRQAVLDTIPAAERRALLRHAADVLLTAGGTPSDVAAALVASADAGDRDAAATLLTAARTLGPADPAAAARVGRRALELIDATDPLRAPLVAETALLLHAAGHDREALAFAEQALQDEDLTAEQEGEILLRVAEMLGLSADVRTAHGRRALALPGLSPGLAARHRVRLLANLAVSGDHAEARAVAETIRVQDGPPTGARVRALALLACAEGDLRKTLVLCDEAERLAHEADDDDQRVLDEIGLMRGDALAALGEVGAALELAERAAAGARITRQAWAERMWDSVRGRQLLVLGRLDEAHTVLQRVIDAGPLGATGDGAALVAYLRVVTHLGDAAGRERALALADDLLREGSRGVRHHVGWMLTLDAFFRGDREGMRRGAAAGVPRFPSEPGDAPRLARVAAALGDPALMDQAVGLARERAACAPHTPVLWGSKTHTEAIASGDAAAMAAAAEHLLAAGAPLAAAIAHEDRAAAVTDRDARIAALDAALQAYASAGAVADLARVRARLRDLGERRRVTAGPATGDAAALAPAAGWGALTEAQRAVAALAAAGLTNRQVGERLHLSPNTVGSHLREAYNKLGVHSRVELMRAHQDALHHA